MWFPAYAVFKALVKSIKKFKTKEPTRIFLNDEITFLGKFLDHFFNSFLLLVFGPVLSESLYCSENDNRQINSYVQQAKSNLDKTQNMVEHKRDLYILTGDQSINDQENAKFIKHLNQVILPR